MVEVFVTVDLFKTVRVVTVTGAGVTVTEVVAETSMVSSTMLVDVDTTVVENAVSVKVLVTQSVI